MGSLDQLDDHTTRSASASIYAGPTWNEIRRGSVGAETEPDGAGASERLAPARSSSPLDDLSTRLRARWQWRLIRVITGQVIDLRWRLLRRVVDDARQFLGLREVVKAQVLVLGGVERGLTIELARRLRERGVMGAPGDEWLHADDELERGLRAGERVDPEELDRRRAALDTFRAAGPLPHAFWGRPPQSDTDDEPVHLEQDTANGHLLVRGWAAAPGRVTGRARVVQHLEDSDDVEPGDILVGHATDPSWTPVLLIVGGIVMEEGGPLSHAAIVARELETPAVLHAGGATTRIPDGATIVVDGDHGTVELVEAEVEEASA